MISAIFINMPVESAARSREFFTSLGFSIYEKFSGEETICVEITSNVRAMMSTSEKFKGFINGKEIASRSTAEAIFSLECNSGEEVRALTEKAFSLGARKVNDFEDHGFMLSWAFEDLDGHLWDLFWMNPESNGN